MSRTTKATGLSHITINRIWRAFDLQPHLVDSFKLSPNPQLIDKVRDIVGLYLNPPAHAVVFCVDVKPQIQALDRTTSLLPLQPGQVERRTHDYKRYGTTSLYEALDAKTGRVIGKKFSRQRAREFRRFLVEIIANVPADLDIHVIREASLGAGVELESGERADSDHAAYGTRCVPSPRECVGAGSQPRCV